MDRRNNDPEYQLHENVDAAEEESRRRAAGPQNQGHDIDRENSAEEINKRENMGRRAPSEVRELHEEGKAP